MSYPLSKALQDRLISLITEFKERTDRYQKEIQAILARAMSIGFHGTSAVDAVAFIVEGEVESERQRISAQVHQDLLDVRTAGERERTLAEEQKAKASQKIADLRNALAALTSKTADKESELLTQIGAERAKSRKFADDLENERRIHEELMMVIAGNAADGDYLRSKLSDREVRQLARIEETRRYVDQLLAKTPEGNQVLEMQRRVREEALLRGSRSK
jgi:23S rRNA pseudoU1915 N3-methylase RlmH